MSTKAQIIERLDSLPADALIAVPAIWTKDSVEDLWEYANDKPLTLTDEQWADVIREFETGEDYDEEELLSVVDYVLSEYEKS